MSHNFTNVVFEGTHKRRIMGLSSNHTGTILRNLETLGLLSSTAELQKLAAAGDFKFSALGEKKKWAAYEIDEAFKNFETSVSDRMAFKINLERAGLMRPNPI